MNWKPISEAKKDGTEYFLLVKDPLGNLVYRLGSFRVDGGFSGDSEPLWLDKSSDDWSTGYASCPLDPIAFVDPEGIGLDEVITDSD